MESQSAACASASTSAPTPAPAATSAPAAAPSTAAAPAAAAPMATDQTSLMQQVAALQRQNDELNKRLHQNTERLSQFQAAKKKEMEALMQGMQEWMKKLGVQNDNHRQEFEKGLQRLVNNGADDNGVWQVMVSASAAAAQREQEYQTLKTQFDELQRQRHGGEFGDSVARVGEKRPADGEPPADASVGDIWASFIADVSSTGYHQ
jgi:chromosome segregation ATPase